MPTTKDQLSVNELMILNSAMRDAEKSLAIGYLMLIGGHLGVHRFYLKKMRSAIMQLLLFAIATISYIVTIVLSEQEANVPFALSVAVLALSGGTLFVWVVVDLFLLPRMVREWNERAEKTIIEQIVQYRMQS